MFEKNSLGGNTTVRRVTGAVAAASLALTLGAACGRNESGGSIGGGTVAEQPYNAPNPRATEVGPVFPQLLNDEARRSAASNILGIDISQAEKEEYKFEFSDGSDGYLLTLINQGTGNTLRILIGPRVNAAGFDGLTLFELPIKNGGSTFLVPLWDNGVESGPGRTAAYADHSTAYVYGDDYSLLISSGTLVPSPTTGEPVFQSVEFDGDPKQAPIVGLAELFKQ